MVVELLCGLKQSPRQWYNRFDNYIIKLGYIKSPFDWCLYMSKLKDVTFIYLILYVDGMLIAPEKMCDIEKLKKILSSGFEMKDLGAAMKILGMDIFRDREKKLFLSQNAYINKVLIMFVISSGQRISILCIVNVYLTMYIVWPGHPARRGIWSERTSGPLGQLVRKDIWPARTSGPLGKLVCKDI